MTRAKCLFCGGKADLLCDSHLGWERKRGEMAKDAPNLLQLPSYRVPLRYRAIHTCDAALCRACATPAGIMFVRMKNMAFAESTDYCPGHEFGDLRTEITGLQAEAVRARWRAAARAASSRAEPGYAEQLGLFTGLLAGSAQGERITT